MDFDASVKLALYGSPRSRGVSLVPDAVAERVGDTPAAVKEAYLRLRTRRLLWLEADGVTVRMAPPFSGVPTQHHVMVDGIEYYANCAWDALGIPAALHRPGLVRSRCEQSLAPLDLHVGLEGPEPSPWLFHCLVPAAKWWDDLVFT
jgi:hypothetical protein